MRFARAPRCCCLLVLLCAGSVILPACARGRSAGRPETAVAPAPAAPVPAPPVPASPPPGRRPGNLATEEILRDLVPGKTTRGEVRERFGTPQEVVLSPGVETFIYYRDRRAGWLSRGTDRVEMLTVRFDARGLLKDFEYRHSGD